MLPNGLAKPKSQSFTMPDFETRIFSGFTSLWIIWKAENNIEFLRIDIATMDQSHIYKFQY